MKQHQKTVWRKGLAISLLCAILCGCAKTQAQPTVTKDASGSSDVSGAEILADISTTQYFTDQEVAQEDIELIVQAGINAPSAMNGQPWHFSIITDAAVLQQISEGMGGGMGFGGMPPSGEGPMDLPEGMTPPEGMDFEIPEGFDGTMPENRDLPNGGGAPAAPAMPGRDAAGGVSKAGITDAPLVIVISCKAGSELDAGLACQNMSATAQLLGYGTKIVTSPTMALNGADQDTFRELLGIPGEYSAAAILLIGHEDTSVADSADGYTGATTRYEADQVVTYISSGK